MYDTEKLKSFPASPGVYIMKGRSGGVLYVGKAKNLRQRVKQYFVPGRDGRYQVPFLIEKVADIETIIVSSEKEALLLENTLIKKHRPKYNVLFKDDKSFIALRLNHKHRWPRLEIVRSRGEHKADALYFGPYTSAHAARRTLDLLNRIFPLRQCSDRELKGRTRPCILHGMKRCVAPCVGLCSKEEYDGYVEQTVKFLRGQVGEVVRELEREMRAFSDTLEFERAAQTKEMIAAIRKTVEAQHVEKMAGGDCDVFALYREAEAAALCQMLYRHGKLVGSRSFHFDAVVQEDAELLGSFILQHYAEKERLPDEILLPRRFEDAAKIGEILSQGRPKKVRLTAPLRGVKRGRVKIAKENARAAFKKERDEGEALERVLLEMKERFRLPAYPRRIECFDSSNISGSEPVAALVSFEEGKKDPKRYRKYKIRPAGAPDDYAAMREALERRLSRGKKEGDLPDLLIVDGGKGQLNIALKVLEKLDIVTVGAVGLAKEEGRHDKGMSAEKLFLPNVKDPLILKRNSPILFMLQKIRDEAHRFAIAFHRRRRAKATVKSALDAVPGIGPAKRKALLQRFGSVKRIREAALEEISSVRGVSLKEARAVKKFLK